MTDHPIRLFTDDAAIAAVGEHFLACTLPKSEWTHEAHLGTCAWLILRRPEIAVERDLPDLIRRYNTSVGGVNDDHQGYHETITQVSIIGVRGVLAGREGDGLVASVNAVLADAVGRRDWPLRFYSRERLFSVPARRGFVEPDLQALPR